ncbi:MAG: pentapeptide repeat-containing protein [Prochloraceae cyanobacterium]|nr:pentapeptide repeat-containing protein [Prochloraceae cyanobacterium]
MELEAIPVSSAKTNIKQFELYLNVNFNEQWESLLEGRIKFGFKGGKLKLRSQNLKAVSIASHLGKELALTSANSQTQADETQTWIFTVSPGETLLNRVLERAKLGTFQVTARPFYLEAIFEVSGENICLTDIEDLWRHDISPNKHAVLERKIALFLLENKFKPYLEWVKLDSEEGKFRSRSREGEKERISPQAQIELKQLIEKIYQARTKNILELAEMADLDPATSFAGGNFVATDLSGLNLSGANFYDMNFRGADLTDADLSEANLSYVKFSGADLSGAYLENANLSHADFHNGSLAVANLICTDLSGANLRNTNLSYANLTGATVSQAQFANNPGISEEMKLKLIERGAIFDRS